MHGYIISHGGDLNENDNFDVWKLIMYGYKKMHADDINKMAVQLTQATHAWLNM